jgi:hypothetical protein
MNELMVAAEINSEEESMEACDFVELGEVSTETKGGVIGHFVDGGLGKWL